MAVREVDRLRSVVLSQQTDSKFKSEVDLAKAMLGSDLVLERVRNVQLSGVLRKQSKAIPMILHAPQTTWLTKACVRALRNCHRAGEHLKNWNVRFFVLAGKFLLYYPRKAKTELPTTACLLTNVVVIADETFKKVRRDWSTRPRLVPD